MNVQYVYYIYLALAGIYKSSGMHSMVNRSSGSNSIELHVHPFRCWQRRLFRIGRAGWPLSIVRDLCRSHRIYMNNWIVTYWGQKGGTILHFPIELHSLFYCYFLCFFTCCKWVLICTYILLYTLPTMYV